MKGKPAPYPLSDDEQMISLADHRAALDAVMRAAVWAMEYVQETERCFTEGRSQDAKRAQAFLALPDVAAWRKEQEKKAQ